MMERAIILTNGLGTTGYPHTKQREKNTFISDIKGDSKRITV